MHDSNSSRTYWKLTNAALASILNSAINLQNDNPFEALKLVASLNKKILISMSDADQAFQYLLISSAKQRP